ncbi:hypothetical protein Q5752_006536 [Cryptotrichosporon argae]
MRKQSATDLAAGGLRSPLDAIGFQASAPRQHPASPPPPVPALDFNFFRSSVYSTVSDSADSDAAEPHTSTDGSPTSPSSLASFQSTVSGPHDQPRTPTAARATALGGDSPATPRAGPSGSYFAQHAVPSDAEADSPTVTPKRGIAVRSRPAPKAVAGAALPVKSAVTREAFALRPVPGRAQPAARSASASSAASAAEPVARDVPLHTSPSPMGGASDLASIHGEQGSDWGDDEADFEWLDNDADAHEARNGIAPLPRSGSSSIFSSSAAASSSTNHGSSSSRPGLGLSPSKRLGKLKAAVAPGLHRAESRRVKKNIVFPRRAPPPPPSVDPAPPPLSPTRAYGWARALHASPSKSRATLHSGPPDSPDKTRISHPAPLRPIPGDRPVLSPRWANPSLPDAAYAAQRPMSMPDATRAAAPGLATSPTSTASAATAPAASFPEPLAASSLPPRSTTLAALDARVPPVPPKLGMHAARLVPLKEDGPSGAAMAPHASSSRVSRNSHFSVQSLAYSFYDLDAGPSTPRALTPSAPGERVEFEPVLRGKYTKVSASALGQGTTAEQADTDLSARASLDKSRAGGSVAGDDVLRSGLEARAKGDLSRAAWMFMRAAEDGSAVGRLYYGLALRHGWGIAKDEKKAFAELSQACDSLVTSTDPASRPESAGLSAAQRSAVSTDVALALNELANCFLDGVGTRKAPEAALQYLRRAAVMGDLGSQEQLGLLLSKGTHGVKRDMKEAARWYRVAITQGSANTFGLAWVWKEKYNQDAAAK